MEKSNVQKLEEYLGLKLAFERKGWEVNFEPDGKVFCFSIPGGSSSSSSVKEYKRFVGKVVN